MYASQVQSTGGSLPLVHSSHVGTSRRVQAEVEIEELVHVEQILTARQLRSTPVINILLVYVEREPHQSRTTKVNIQTSFAELTYSSVVHYLVA